MLIVGRTWPEGVSLATWQLLARDPGVGVGHKDTWDLRCVACMARQGT